MGAGRDIALNVPVAPTGGSIIIAPNAVVVLMVGCGVFVQIAIPASMGKGNRLARCAVHAPTVGSGILAHNAKVVPMVVCGVFAGFAMDVHMEN